MYNIKVNEKYLLIASFMEMGFKSKTAFLNVCLGIDKTIAIWELHLYWDLGICVTGFENKIENIINQLKQE